MCGTHSLLLSCGLFAYRAVPYSLQSPPLRAVASTPAPLVSPPSAPVLHVQLFVGLTAGLECRNPGVLVCYALTPRYL